MNYLTLSIINVKKKSKQRWRKLSSKEAVTGYAFIAPALALIIFFIIIPIFFAFGLSFCKWELIKGARTFIGLGNYVRLLRDDLFRKSVFNTFYFVIGSVPLSVFPGLILAFLIDQKWFKGKPLVEVIYFLPVVIGWVEIAMVWRWLFNPDYGLVNYVLNIFRLPGQNWLGSSQLAMPSIILVHAWKMLGYNMILFLAGLRNIPERYYEAAEIDGASRWNIFWYITLPLLKNTTFLVLVLNVIYSFQVFPQSYVMTQGGPYYATYVVVYNIYNTAFQFYKLGYAAAMAFILFAFMFFFTLLQRKVFGKEIEY